LIGSSLGWSYGWVENGDMGCRYAVRWGSVLSHFWTNKPGVTLMCTDQTSLDYLTTCFQPWSSALPKLFFDRYKSISGLVSICQHKTDQSLAPFLSFFFFLSGSSTPFFATWATRLIMPNGQFGIKIKSLMKLN